MAISGFLFDGREVLQSLDYDGKNHVIYSVSPSFFRVRIDNANYEAGEEQAEKTALPTIGPRRFSPS